MRHPLLAHWHHSGGLSEWPLPTDTVEKLRKRIAVKFRPNDILSENRCSMPPQCGYGGRLLLQRQLPRPPQIFFQFSSPRLYKLWLIAENRVFQQYPPFCDVQTDRRKWPLCSGHSCPCARRQPSHPPSRSSRARRRVRDRRAVQHLRSQRSHEIAASNGGRNQDLRTPSFNSPAGFAMIASLNPT